eukprot:6709470-Pyramimonas_sp.AAC.1
MGTGSTSGHGHTQHVVDDVDVWVAVVCIHSSTTGSLAYRRRCDDMMPRLTNVAAIAAEKSAAPAMSFSAARALW